MVSASGAEMDLSKFAWKTTWDFEARQLSAQDGLSSSVSFVRQPCGNSLFVFGWLGAIRAGTSFGSPFVGFAQVFTPDVPPMNTPNQKLQIKMRTDSPEIALQLVLIDEKTEAQNALPGSNRTYQSDISIDDSLQELTFTPNDFQLFERGKLVGAAIPVDLDKVRRLGFQVTKSSQTPILANQQARLPFQFEILSIAWIDEVRKD